MSQESDKVSDNFWPSLKKTLEEDSNNFDRLDISCQICFEPTTVGGQPYRNYAPKRDHRATILPCGHIFGDSCIATYLREGEQPARKPNCPACRANLKHAGCPHACLGTPVPNCPAEVSTVLPILSEGGKIAEVCCLCELGETVECLIHKIMLTTTVPPDHFICALANFPTDHLWVRLHGDETPQEAAEVEWETQMSEAFRELIDESEAQLRQKHLQGEWNTGNLAGLQLRFPLCKDDDEERIAKTRDSWAVLGLMSS